MRTILEGLEATLTNYAPADVAVAVSGGVDSMTLAFVTARVLSDKVTMFHAVSPAVPVSASERVKAYAQACGWRLEIINAGEFDDAAYIANPANRCFHCKKNLYATIVANTNAQVLSGTNLDDLSDWRPGLKAAENHAVRHPFVEAGIDKQGVREIARLFELADIAELPAAPCLSSRVETGIPINPGELRFIDAAERMIRSAVDTPSVRCRLRKSGIVIELDLAAHATLAGSEESALSAEVQRLAATHKVAGEVSFAPYLRGSAFLREHE